MTTTAHHPNFGDEVDETLELVGVIPVAGPAAIFIAAPWLLLGLMLAGPFAFLVTFVLVVVAAAVLVALTAAIVAAPFVAARHIRRSWAAHAPTGRPVPWDARLRRAPRHLQHQEGTS